MKRALKRKMSVAAFAAALAISANALADPTPEAVPPSQVAGSVSSAPGANVQFDPQSDGKWSLLNKNRSLVCEMPCAHLVTANSGLLVLRVPPGPGVGQTSLTGAGQDELYEVPKSFGVPVGGKGRFAIRPSRAGGRGGKIGAGIVSIVGVSLLIGGGALEGSNCYGGCSSGTIAGGAALIAAGAATLIGGLVWLGVARSASADIVPDTAPTPKPTAVRFRWLRPFAVAF